MSFDASNKSHKKQLYPIIKELADLSPHQSPELVIDQALGQPLARGKDYLSNVRKSDYAKSIASLRYTWLRNHHFDRAHRLAPDIFPETPAMRWRQIIDERAIEGALRIIPTKRDMGLVERADAVDPSMPTLKLGQRFHFELDSETSGTAIALQGLGDQWVAFPLIEDGTHALSITEGKNILPQKHNGSPDPIVENRDPGQHDFVLIVSKSETPPLTIEHQITWVNEKEGGSYTVKLTFEE